MIRSAGLTRVGEGVAEMIARLLAILICAVCALPVPAVAASGAAVAGQTHFVLGSPAAAPYVRGDGSGYLERLYRELFARLGLSAEIISLPAERALINAENGIEDGDAMRVHGMEKPYPNLIRIDEPVVWMDFMAFVVRPDVTLASWKDLERYSVALVTGWKIAEENTQSVREITYAATPAQLFSVLEKGRADVAVFERWQGLSYVKASGGTARAVEPPLASMPMYLYVNRKHQALSERLRDTLRAMRADGTVARIAAEALRP